MAQKTLREIERAPVDTEPNRRHGSGSADQESVADGIPE
jgi:hypothetical protein